MIFGYEFEGRELLGRILQAHDISDPALSKELTEHAETYMGYMNNPLDRTPEHTAAWEKGNVTRELVVPLADFIRGYDEILEVGPEPD